MDTMVTLDGSNDVLTFLADPIRAVRAALDHGMSWADTVLDARPRDPHMWAHLVRYEARNELGDGAADWTVSRLLNSGIEIVRAPLVMRTMKAQDGGPPSPGHSRNRNAYWTQQGSLGLDWAGIKEPEFGANLILDWATDADRTLQLCLSKPIGIWKYRSQPKLAWSLPVEFDADDVPGFVISEESVEVEPKFDLDELGADGAEQ
jgi:hypothetical protein